MDILISAIICTRNRSDYLRKAIKSLADQTLPINCYEILVVDNASTDHTQQVVFQEFASVNNVRYLYEPIVGIARARNKGWAEAIGKYVCYLDDDEIASRDWLEKITEAFKAAGPRLCLIGGRIDPIWESRRPPWLSKKIECYVSIINHADSVMFLNLSGFYVSGGNMAIPRTLLKEVGGFNHKFSRGEDTFLQMDLMLRGYECFYHPDILVKHHIRQYRMTKRYFVRLAFASGVLRAMMIMCLKSVPVSERLKRAAAASVKLLKKTGELLDFMVHCNDPKKFYIINQIMFNLGNIMGFLGIKNL